MTNKYDAVRRELLQLTEELGEIENIESEDYQIIIRKEQRQDGVGEPRAFTPQRQTSTIMNIITPNEVWGIERIERE